MFGQFAEVVGLARWEGKEITGEVPEILYIIKNYLDDALVAEAKAEWIRPAS
jgi:hypothetical protein